MSSWLGWTVRLLAVLVIVWALMPPLSWRPTVADAEWVPFGAASPSPKPSAVAAMSTQRSSGTIAQSNDPNYFPETGFAVAPGSFSSYFRARGGARTFGPPISNQFTLGGQSVQIFRNAVLKQNLDGSVTTISLLGTDAIPSLQISGRTLPPFDAQLAAQAPDPASPNYGAQVQEFIRANVPDQWDGVQVGFYTAFLGTVTFADAFPSGSGDRGLLPGFALEVWGMPVSRPMRDPASPSLVYLRWERGVMEFDRRLGTVQAVPLGEFFKAVLTGENLPPDLAASASGSPYFRQVDPLAPMGVARAGELPDSNLIGAFQPTGQPVPGNVAGAAAGGPVVGQYMTPTPTVPSYMPMTPTATPPYGPPGAPGPYATPNPYPPTGPYATPTATYVGSVPGAPGSTGGQIPGGTPGPDVCYGDERITYSPEVPRVNNELLIAVTSSRPHPFGRLAGTERTNFVRERPGQAGIVWEWTVNLTHPGDHEYVFYVDSTLPCQRVKFRVEQPLATRTPTPTKTPRGYCNPYDPYGSNCNGNDNGSNNDNSSSNDNGSNENGNGNDNFFFPTGTPTPTPTFQQVAFNPSAYLGQGDRYNCVDFTSQANAQAVLRADPSDPNRLDTGSPQNQQSGGDGIACNTQAEAPEWSAVGFWPPPMDQTPVARPNITATAIPPPPTPVVGATQRPLPPTPVIPMSQMSTTGQSSFVSQSDRFDCVHFKSQADAQAVLRADPSDPHRLDTGGPTDPNSGGDGIACNTMGEAPEWARSFRFPSPLDLTPVPRPHWSANPAASR